MTVMTHDAVRVTYLSYIAYSVFLFQCRNYYSYIFSMLTLHCAVLHGWPTVLFWFSGMMQFIRGHCSFSMPAFFWHSVLLAVDDVAVLIVLLCGRAKTARWYCVDTAAQWNVCIKTFTFCTQLVAWNCQSINLISIFVFFFAFAVAAPRVWNSLPTDIKLHQSTTASFKRRLKTVLFNRGFAEHM